MAAGVGRDCDKPDILDTKPKRDRKIAAKFQVNVFYAHSIN